MKVLNAFRHQRDKHSSVACLSIRARACSTPSGIRGINTEIDTYHQTPDTLCSTPSGIRGINTTARTARNKAWNRAQRLPASEG